jgi:multidrug efflux pump subunit AcrA (membrane-fusion protein)
MPTVFPMGKYGNKGSAMLDKSSGNNISTPSGNDGNRRAALAVVLVALAGLGYAAFKEMRGLPPDHAQRVSLEIPGKDAPVRQTGWLQGMLEEPAAPARRELAVGFRITGNIAEMLLAEGAAFKKGDVLATLDKAPFEEALLSARAKLQLALAEYNKSTHLPPSIFHSIEAARANLETAEYAHDTAQAELERRRGTFTAGYARYVDNVYDNTAQNERDARLDMERKRRELAYLQDSAVNNMNLDAARAGLQAAYADVTLAETQLTDTRLLAPADGVIARRASEVGVNVPAGAPVYVLSIPSAAGSDGSEAADREAPEQHGAATAEKP